MLDLFTRTILTVKGMHPATDSQDTLYLLTISTRSISSRTFAEEDRGFCRVVKLSESG
jgi:hypothetical protein